MSRLSESLLKLRKALGFRSAQAFYRHATEIGGIQINYPHYKKIESGLALPKADFVNRLAGAFPEQASGLIHAFCQDLFPAHASLFGEAKVSDPAPAPATQASQPLLYAQDELTQRQVAVIARSEWHYGLYLLLNLARRPVSAAELRKSMPELPPEAAADLIAAKLAYADERGYKATAIESLFPEPTTEALKLAYRRMDQWDLVLHQRFGLEKQYRRVMLRRISPRYLPLIRKFAELLADQIRSSDESDIARNDDVIFLSLDIRSGKIPG